MTEDVPVRAGTFLPAKGHADVRTIFFTSIFLPAVVTIVSDHLKVQQSFIFIMI